MENFLLKFVTKNLIFWLKRAINNEQLFVCVEINIYGYFQTDVIMCQYYKTVIIRVVQGRLFFDNE